MDSVTAKVISELAQKLWIPVALTLAGIGALVLYVGPDYYGLMNFEASSIASIKLLAALAVLIGAGILCARFFDFVGRYAQKWWALRESIAQDSRSRELLERNPPTVLPMPTPEQIEQRQITQRLESRLGRLTRDEKAILRSYVAENVRSCDLDVRSGTVFALQVEGIIYPASTIGRGPNHLSYAINEYPLAYLRDHPELLKDGV